MNSSKVLKLLNSYKWSYLLNKKSPSFFVIYILLFYAQNKIYFFSKTIGEIVRLVYAWIFGIENDSVTFDHKTRKLHFASFPQNLGECFRQNIFFLDLCRFQNSKLIQFILKYFNIYINRINSSSIFSLLSFISPFTFKQ